LDGLGLTTVSTPAEADFLLAHGTEAVNGPGEDDAARAAGRTWQILHASA